MCVVCGCSDASPDHARFAARDEGHADVVQVKPGTGDLHFGAGAARVSVPGMSQARAIRLETDILAANAQVAQQNRVHFEAHGVTALNLVSSPGSGKTTLLCATIDALKARSPDLHVAVIEGDQQTSFDADRIRATGAPAIQINTGKGCHLDAPMVAEAFARLHGHGGHDHDEARGSRAAGQAAHSHDPDGHGQAQEQAQEHAHGHAQGHGHEHAHGQEQRHEHEHAHGHGHEHGHAASSLLFIENVGNLVCPALWDLGETAKVAILSVTEGDDKPLKYPDMFAAARLMIVNKIDLLPHVSFDVARCIEYARRVNPTLEILQLSATTGEGMGEWLHWLDHARGHDHRHAAPEASATEAALRERVQQLEAELAHARAALSADLAH